MTDRLQKAVRFWRQNPIEAVKAWFNVTPEDYQGDIIMSLLGPKAGNRSAVKSAHGVGKTTVQAWSGWIFIVTRPFARIPATAPTQSQLKDILWPEFAKWHDRMPDDLKAMYEVSETHIRHKMHPKTWFAVARTSNKPDNLQGFHNDHVLVLVEEASGVPHNVFPVIEGILTNADEHGSEAKLLMSGNPTQLQGEFYDAFHKNKELFARFTISGDPVIPKDPTGGKIYSSKRVTEAYRQTIAKKYGLQSPVYDVRVRGLFPSMMDDVVIPLAWAEAAAMIKPGHFDDNADKFKLVMDVARFGGDETTLGVFRGGALLEIKAWPKTSTNQCVDILRDKILLLGPSNVAMVVIDEPGIGGGVIDQATREGMPVVPYHGGASLVPDIDSDEDCRMFANRRSRDWWVVRRKMEAGEFPMCYDETTINQLASVKYIYNTRDKIQVESKGDMRERLGEDASPDRADTIVMGLAPTGSLVSKLPVMELLDLPSNVHYGTDRPTADEMYETFNQ